MRAQERVYVGMRARIREFSLEPGRHLNIAEIADEYDASAIPVREALARLAAEGLVDHEPRTGFAVPAVSVRRLIDDNTMIFLFIRHVTDLFFEAEADVRGELMTALDRSNEGLATDAQTAEALTREIEEAIEHLFGMTQSSKLVSAVRAALDSSHAYRITFFRLFPVPDYIDLRRRYADALRRGDDRGARDLVRLAQQQFAQVSRDVCREVALAIIDRS